MRMNAAQQSPSAMAGTIAKEAAKTAGAESQFVTPTSTAKSLRVPSPLSKNIFVLQISNGYA